MTFEEDDQPLARRTDDARKASATDAPRKPTKKAKASDTRKAVQENVAESVGAAEHEQAKYVVESAGEAANETPPESGPDLTDGSGTGDIQTVGELLSDDPAESLSSAEQTAGSLG